VRAVREALGPIRPNIAILLDEHGTSLDEARAFARCWMLDSDEHVDKAVEAIAERAWPHYESCYPEGLRLCRAFVDRVPGGLRRLLTEQLTTTDVTG
jgi:hypothetical protein